MESIRTTGALFAVALALQQSPPPAEPAAAVSSAATGTLIVLNKAESSASLIDDGQAWLVSTR